MVEEKKRVGIYIDGANLYFCAREYYLSRGQEISQAKKSAKLDIARMTAWLADGREISKMCYFNSIAPDSSGLNNFYACCKNRGYRVFLREQKTYGSGETHSEAGVDVELAVHAIMDAAEWDTIILLSGDVDFLPVVEALLAMNKEVEVVSVKATLGEGMMKSDAILRYLDEFLEKNPGHSPKPMVLAPLPFTIPEADDEPSEPKNCNR